MQTFARILFISGLLLIASLASFFMILESGSFYNSLYANDHPIFGHMGYWAAFLTEIFMAIMAAVQLPATQKGKKRSIHPANFLIRFILVLLFITTVGGASLHVITPKLEALQSEQNRTEVIDLLNTQIKGNTNSISAFIEQNQRTNTALSVRKQHEVQEELKKNLQSKSSTFALWSDIIILILLRFSVQLANLTCVWLAGWLYRYPLEREQSKGEAVHTNTQSSNDLSIQKQNFQKKILEFHNKNAQAVSQEKVLPKKINRENKETEKREDEKEKIVQKQDLKEEKISLSKEHKIPKNSFQNEQRKSKEKAPKSIQSALPIHASPTLRQPVTRQPILEKAGAVVALHPTTKTTENSSSRMDFGSVRPARILLPKNEERSFNAVTEVRKEIISILQQRNEGVSLGEICTITGVSEREMREILNKKVTFKAQHLSRLKIILKKVKALARQAS